MTARYRVMLMPFARADDRAIQTWFVSNQDYERADQWEEGFTRFLRTLTRTPHHKVVSPATLEFPDPIRSIVYRPTRKGAAYTIYFTIEEAQRPDPEPDEDYFAGIVRVIGIRPASALPLTDEEIGARRKTQ
jgi:hypothetical protein